MSRAMCEMSVVARAVEVKSLAQEVFEDVTNKRGDCSCKDLRKGREWKSRKFRRSKC